MSGFWPSPESPEELGLTCEARESPQEKAWYFGWLCGSWQPFPGRNKGCFPERWLTKEPAGTMEASRILVKPPVQEKPDGRCVALLLCPEGRTEKST